MLGAWWHRDDWGLLARAQGLTAPEGPARFVSRDLVWRALHPLFGLDPVPWAVTRLLLLAAIAVLTVLLARRLRLGEGATLLAGLLAAWAPLAFTPLHWAAGIQELLGGVFALAALESLLARGGRRWLVIPWGVLAVFSKESALGLPLLILLLAAAGVPERRDRRGPLLAGLLLLIASLAAGWFVLRQFDHGDGLTYDLSLLAAPVNLGRYGWWLATAPWPAPTVGDAGWSGMLGLAFWTFWTVAAWRRWRTGDRRPAALLAAALLALGPALLLRTHLREDLALLAWVPAALTLAVLCDRGRGGVRPATALGAALIVAAVAYAGTEVRLKLRRDDGLPRDRSVRGAAIAYNFFEIVRNVPGRTSEGFVVIQPDAVGAPTLRLTEIASAVAGDLGPRVYLPDGPRVAWRTDLDAIPADALVLADDGRSLRFWGRPVQARLVLAAVRIGQGYHGEALDLLLDALTREDETVPLMLDPAMLTVPAADVRAGLPAFLAHVSRAGLTPARIAAVRQVVTDLLDGAGLAPPPSPESEEP